MRKSIGLWLLAAVLFAAQASFAQDDAKSEAEKHFKAGLALFKAEKYDAAALELEASVKLYPTKGGLFNLANIYKVMSRYDDALDAMARLERDYSGRLDAEMQGAVERMRAEIEGLVARLDLRVSPAGAVVLVDGREVGKSPLAKRLAVDPGKHVVRAELDGHRPAEVKVQLLAGQVERIDLSLESVSGRGEASGPEQLPAVETEEPAGAGSKTDPADRHRKKIGPVPLIVVGVVAVGAGVATIVLGAKTGDLSDEAKAQGDQGKMDDAKRLQTAGRAMFGVTIGAGVAAVVLAFFTDFGGKEQGETGSSASAAVELDGPLPLAFEGGAGAAIRGRF